MDTDDLSVLKERYRVLYDFLCSRVRVGPAFKTHHDFIRAIRHPYLAEVEEATHSMEFLDQLADLIKLRNDIISIEQLYNLEKELRVILNPRILL